MPAVIPAAASENAPKSIRQDRAYQIAAAQFYAGNFSKPKAGFAAIANDPASPYRTIAPYLVARALVREGNSGAGSDDVNLAALAQAEKQLRNILADKDLKEIHHAAQHLLAFVRIRLHPQERAKELEAILLSGSAGPDFGQDLTDFLWLLDHPVQPRLNPASSAPGRSPTATPGARSQAATWPIRFLLSSNPATKLFSILSLAGKKPNRSPGWRLQFLKQPPPTPRLTASKLPHSRWHRLHRLI